MNRFPLKQSLLAVAMACAVSACGMNDTRDDYADDEVRTERTRVAAEPAPRRETAPVRDRTPKATRPAVADRDVDVDVEVEGDVDVDSDLAIDDDAEGRGITGVAECDEYLARYRGCHRVIGAFPAEGIESRYQSLRSSLLERSLDPAQRESLGANCRSLATTMEEALNDRECLTEDAPVADTDNLTDDELDTDN